MIEFWESFGYVAVAVHEKAGEPRRISIFGLMNTPDVLGCSGIIRVFGCDDFQFLMDTFMFETQENWSQSHGKINHEVRMKCVGCLVFGFLR